MGAELCKSLFIRGSEDNTAQVLFFIAHYLRCWIGGLVTDVQGFILKVTRVISSNMIFALSDRTLKRRGFAYRHPGIEDDRVYRGPLVSGSQEGKESKKIYLNPF